MMNLPSASVVAVFNTPAAFRTMTVAPNTTAPEVSVTVPPVPVSPFSGEAVVMLLPAAARRRFLLCVGTGRGGGLRLT